MGKKIILLLFLILFSFQVYAQPIFTITIARPEYAPGETVQINLIMDSFDLSKIKVVDSNGTKVSVAFFQTQLENGTYYLYFNIPLTTKQGIYNFVVEDKRVIDGSLKLITESQTFSVVEVNKSMSIMPAAKIIDGGSSFSVSLKNVGKDPLTVAATSSSSEITPLRSSLELAVGEQKTLFLNYNFAKLEKAEEEITLSYDSKNYKIPVFIKKEVTPINETKQSNETAEPPINITPPANITSPKINVTKEEPKVALKFLTEKTSFEGVADQNKVLFGNIKFTNLLDKPLHNLTFTLSGNLKEVAALNFNWLNIIAPEEIKEQIVTINKNRNATPKTYSGNFVIDSAEGYSANFYMFFEFTPTSLTNFSKNKDANETSIFLNYSESQKEGKKQEGGISGVYIVLFLAIIIVLILFWRFKRKTSAIKLETYVESLKK
ncbi:hypothetical protein HY643_01480, partial [Candidatus Woesearchaeota archaeon]|nr:hypothetical protein [Candidatus Woesearchaeota archaeon]